MGNNIFRFTIGHFQCVVIRDWDEVDCNVLLVNTSQHHVLIDTGLGDTTTPPGALVDRLRTIDIPPTAIDTVVLTHADFDHIGGAIDECGKLMFPYARYVLSREELGFWDSKPERLRSSDGFDAEFRRLLQTVPVLRLAHLRDIVELIDPEAEIVEGIRAIAAPGHTPGYLAIVIASGDEQLLYIGDLIRDPKDIENPTWYSVFDLNPEHVIATQQRLVAHAASEGMLVMASHLPFPGLGYVAQYGPAWRWQTLNVSEEPEGENRKA